jgi:hypothetical protein
MQAGVVVDVHVAAEFVVDVKAASFSRAALIASHDD